MKSLDRQPRRECLLFHSIPLGFSEGPSVLSSLPLIKVALLGYYGRSLLRDLMLSTRHFAKETILLHLKLPSTNDLGWVFCCGMSEGVIEVCVLSEKFENC